MNAQGERWTAEQVLALAPDAASRKAGGKLATPGPWSGAGAHGRGVWGLCAGSGSKPYQTVVDLDGPAYRCSCPSRKFPCKHALGLLLLWAGGGGVPEAEGPPEWAGEWLAGRRERAAREASGAAAETAAGGRKEPGGVADPQAARRRAERRARRIAAGASELEQRLADLLRDGLAGADRSGYAVWEETAARMVDAQAPGLGARVRELGAIPSSGPGWPGRLLEECALLHLLNQGYARLDLLPEALAAATRSRVGLTTTTAELLASGAAVRDRWLVLGRRDDSDGRLTTRRIWLRGQDTGRVALLLSFGAAGHSPELALPVGVVLDADLTYYPAGRPLRAALGTRHPAPPLPPGPAAPSAPSARPAPSAPSPSAPSPSASSAPSVPSAPSPSVPPGSDIPTALAAYGDALCEDPWLDAWPVVLSGVTPIPGGEDGWQLADTRTGAALPIDPRCAGRTDLWQLTAVSGGGPVTVFGECGHRGFAPLTTWDPAPVPLQSPSGAGSTPHGGMP
ncbi:SWIM zinc finger family protein [Streptomyces sparsogenes]|uniref:SWIM zinc finger family protein n=1 Tax=Streptomyces sparsogenes TaxID=67365 RepID=UPI00340DC4BD